MTHIQYPIKCLNCGLHYIVCTWDHEKIEDGTDNNGKEISETDSAWPVQHDGGYCPECGNKGSRKMIWRRGTPEQIFAVVPGKSTDDVAMFQFPAAGDRPPGEKQ